MTSKARCRGTCLGTSCQVEASEGIDQIKPIKRQSLSTTHLLSLGAKDLGGGGALLEEIGERVPLQAGVPQRPARLPRLLPTVHEHQHLRLPRRLHHLDREGRFEERGLEDRMLFEQG